MRVQGESVGDRFRIAALLLCVVERCHDGQQADSESAVWTADSVLID